MMKSTIITVITTAILGIIFLLLNYFWQVPISLDSGIFLFHIVLISILSGVFSFVIAYIKSEGFDLRGYSSIPHIIIAIIPFVFVVIFLFFRSPIFTSEARRELITVEEKEFSSNIEAVDLTQLPTVDKKYAKKLADKKMGEVSGLGSETDLGEFTMQSVNGKLYWVSPLVHSGFFKWYSNKEGTPGYVMVSATDSNDVKLVQSINNKDILIRYQKESFFGTDLVRHVQSAYKNYNLTDYSFEIDDSGNPFWVVTVYTNTIGYTGEVVKGIILVDAQTGKMDKYTIDDAPSWIDRIQPEEICLDQINGWGKLVHGVFNFSDKDKLMTTDGSNVVYNNGTCYYYTGITSTGADESTTGFVLINSRTKEVSLYKVSGATENAAQDSAEGKVQNLGYSATFPILINVEGNATYFMTLKDDAGLVKLYAMVNVENYNIVATSETLKGVQTAYVSALKTNGNSTSLETENEVNLTGTVERISASVVDGNTFYYIILKESKDIIFVVPNTISDEVPVTLAGDQVTISYNESAGLITNVLSFDNLSFTQKTK